MLGLLFLACAHAPAPVVAPVVPAAVAVPPLPAPEPEPDELTLERTACSGECPVYTLTVRANGRVHFTGVADVAAVGERDWRMEPAFAKHLFSEFTRADFFHFAARAPTEVEEFPGLVLTLRREGRVHRVQLGGEGTAELPRDREAERMLQRLAVTIDKLTASGRYVETDSKRKAGGCVD